MVVVRAFATGDGWQVEWVAAGGVDGWSQTEGEPPGCSREKKTNANSSVVAFGSTALRTVARSHGYLSSSHLGTYEFFIVPRKDMPIGVRRVRPADAVASA